MFYTKHWVCHFAYCVCSYSGLWELVSFSWISPLLSAGYKAPLVLSQLYLMHRTLDLPNPNARLLTRTAAALEKQGNTSDLSLLWMIHRAYFYEIWWGGILMLGETISSLAIPQLLYKLLLFIETDKTDADTVWEGYAWAFAMVLFQLLQGQFDAQ